MLFHCNALLGARFRSLSSTLYSGFLLSSYIHDTSKFDVTTVAAIHDIQTEFDYSFGRGYIRYAPPEGAQESQVYTSVRKNE